MRSSIMSSLSGFADGRVVSATLERRRSWILTIVACAVTSGCTSPTPTRPPHRFFDDVPSTMRSFTERQLPGLVSEGNVAAHVSLSGEGRFSLISTPPSRLSFFVDLPSRPRLRFSIAQTPVATHGRLDRARFRIRARSRRGTETVFDETVRPRDGRRWLDREVDLTAWAGRRVEILLETRAVAKGGDDAKRGVATLWGDPVVVDSPPSTHPHLVLISVDCLRADHVGAYGYSRATTPNLDSFAASAVVFESAIASAPWTIPSHTSMLTGLPPSLHGVADHQNAYWGGTADLLSPTVPLLPEILSDAGYDTHAVVTGAPLSTAYGFHRGFSTFRQMAPDASAAVDAALRVLSRTRDRPQFLFLHLVDAHAPYQPKVDFKTYSRDFIQRFGPRPRDISDLLAMVGDYAEPRSPSDVEGVVQLYDAAVAYVDHHLGRFFDEIEAAGILDRAIVIVTADHGEGFYEHGTWQHSTTLYEELTHVPLIVRWPDARLARVDAPAALVDILPTFLIGADLPVPATEGQDLRSLLNQGTRSNIMGTASEVTLAGEEGMRSLVSFRNGDSKYIATLDGAFDEIEGDEILFEELYDLARDPMETNNLAGEDDITIRAMRAVLSDYVQMGRSRRKVWERGDDADLDEETLRELRALGYVP